LRCQHEQGASDIGDFSSWGKPARSGKSNYSKSRVDTDQPGARDRVGEGAFHGYQVDDKQSPWLARAYGIVRYGTDPKGLSKTAKNPIRLSPDHSSTVFRVRLDNLKPRTTYYYRVDSMESDGKSDGVTSPVQSFTTQ
jgi:hypothetical protein